MFLVFKICYKNNIFKDLIGRFIYYIGLCKKMKIIVFFLICFDVL